MQGLGPSFPPREKHEAAPESNGLVEAERVQARFDAAHLGHTAITVHRCGTYIFDAAEQRLAAVFADHIAEQLTEKAHIGVLCDDRGRWRHESLVDVVSRGWCRY